MPNNITESSSFVTPDSLRKSLQLSKSFYDCHTKKNYERVDSTGSWYSGIVENYAAELLIESRKLLMEKPSLENFIISSTFDFYFDIQYSSLIPTYDQQNVLIAVLKKDVLLPNKEYRIKFNGFHMRKILRSESWSDPTIKCNNIYETSSSPILMVHDIETDTDTEIPMSIDVNSPIKTVQYSFLVNNTTSNFIESHNDDTLISVKLSNNMADLPFIWISCDSFRSLPELNLDEDKDADSNNLLVIGTDGNNISKIYPLIYGSENVPVNDSGITDKTWFIKVLPAEGEKFYESDSINNDNFSVGISEIHYVYADDMSTEPIIDTMISIDNSHAKITLSEDHTNWNFKAPVNGDYDYKGAVITPVYAYITLDTFNSNYTYDQNFISAFNVKFDDEYLSPSEVINCNATSGIHVDTSSEYSNNGIDKLNGMLHGLGEFDGLPSYFNELADRTIHRAHTELYSIRNNINNRNQTYVDKQTAALLIDSSMPRKEVQNLLSSLDVVIKYKNGPIIPYPHEDKNAGIYYTDPNVKIESKYNQISEVTYADANTFGNSTMPRYKLMPKFVYHGNRKFSLDLIEPDQELESARVYCLSNDGSDYINNEISNYKKPERTLCRICDIPSTFVSLLNIVGSAPTLIIDDDYIRMGSELKEADKLMLYNDKYNTIVSKRENSNPHSNDIYIFDMNVDLNTELTSTYINDSYYSRGNFNPIIDLATDGCSFEIIDNGSDYVVDDTFISILGGVSYRGTVTRIDDGKALTITLDINDNNRYVSYYNLITTDEIPYGTVMKTTTTSGAGTGLRLSLELEPETREKLKQTRGPVTTDLIAFKYDKFKFIWIYKYNTETQTWSQYCQVTGDVNINNTYDDTADQFKRDIISVKMKNMMYQCHNMSSSSFTDPLSNKNLMIKNTISTTIPIDYTTFNSTNDLSQNFKNVNKQDTYYSLYADPFDLSATTYKLRTYERYAPGYTNFATNERVMSRFNNMNISHYYSKANSFSMEYRDDFVQPSIYVYSPTKSEIGNISLVSPGLYKYNNKHELTFMDIFYPDGIPDVPSKTDVVDIESCLLNTNIYVYNEYDLSDTMTDFIMYLNSLTRDELIQLIDDRFGPLSAPSIYEETELEYSVQGLINYIALNYYDNPTYLRNSIKLMRKAKDHIVDKNADGTYTGIGKQPTGAYVSLNDEVYDPRLKIDNKDINADIQYIFRIDDFPNTEYLSENYRIRDNAGNDISDKSLIIINNLAYVLSSQGSWIHLNKYIKEK